MNAPTYLVTGGTGLLGSLVVERMRTAGGGVRVMSHNGRPGTVRGDLLTGEGLAEAVDGINTIVHCASNPVRSRQTDVAGTERLLQEAAGSGVSHFVFISIVGVDRDPYFPYYRAKLEAELTIERSPVPWTILRSTQFHSFVLGMLGALDHVPLFMPVPKGFLLQPIDVGEVASRLVELALSEPTGRAPDVSGPEVRVFADLARSYLKVAGRSGRVVEVPVPGKTALAFRQGAHLVPGHGYGRTTWEEHLSRSIHPIKEKKPVERNPYEQQTQKK